jgi:hypothetical protein
LLRLGLGGCARFGTATGILVVINGQNLFPSRRLAVPALRNSQARTGRSRDASQQAKAPCNSKT